MSELYNNCKIHLHYKDNVKYIINVWKDFFWNGFTITYKCLVIKLNIHGFSEIKQLVK